MAVISQLKQFIMQGGYDDQFLELYGTRDVPRLRYAGLCDEALVRFGDREAVFFSAPGRTEVGGNHTDHQLGAVLAAAISLDIACIAVKTEDQSIIYTSDAFTVNPVDISDTAIHPEEQNTTEALIRGIAAGFRIRDYKTGGFSCYAESNVLPGSGMSSSAAFEVLIGTILSHFYNDGNIDPVEIAKCGQYAENVYFMKASGLMDQTASSVGGFVAIDFYDKENPRITPVLCDLDAYGYDLLITDVKASHADLSDEYSLIPQEMKLAAGLLNQDVLSRVTVDDVASHAKEIRETFGDRTFLRAYHFVKETERAKQEKEALENKDIKHFLSLVNESGRSSYMYLQNVLVKGEDRNQALALSLALSDYVLGSEGAFRVHGGGFAGTIQAFVPKAKTKEYIAVMESVFGEGCVYVLKIRSAGGYRFQ